MTVKTCDCNFSVRIKVSTEFQNKIQWAFLKFSKIREFKWIKFIKSGFSIYGQWYVAGAVNSVRRSLGSTSRTDGQSSAVSPGQVRRARPTVTATHQAVLTSIQAVLQGTRADIGLHCTRLYTQNYWSNVSVLEYSFISTSGRKFQYPVSVFQMSEQLLKFYANLAPSPSSSDLGVCSLET